MIKLLILYDRLTNGGNMKTLADDMHSKNLENETYTDINTLLLNSDKKVVRGCIVNTSIVWTK